MKVLYAVQGTGNGHVSRACDVIPEIQKYAHVDILISGYQSDIELPFIVKYKLYGISFIFGKHGGVDIFETIKKAKIFKFFHDIKTIPVEKYDLVINDFEPITAWACRRKGVPCISLSHQSAVLHPKAPKPKKTDWLGKIVLKYYAPTKIKYGFHFRELDTNIFTPIIRKDIQKAKTQNLGHYTVYLPSFDDDFLVHLFNQIPTNWHVFSKRAKIVNVYENVTVQPVSQIEFGESMLNCEGILCGAGFETPAEALYLGKKLMVIPMKGQYEQQCNAAALKDLGIPVIYTLSVKSIEKINQWVTFGNANSIKYEHKLPKIIQKVFNDLNLNLK